MKLIYSLLSVMILFLTLVMIAHADEGRIKVPSPQDRAISCEVHCAYAEMGHPYALEVIRLLPCDCGFNYQPNDGEKKCK